MENALEWVITALGHYHRLEKTQENESALQCLRNAIELLQKEESCPKGIILNTEELGALYSAILSHQSQLKKNLDGLKDPVLVAGWERDFQALETVKAKATKAQVKP